MRIKKQGKDLFIAKTAIIKQPKLLEVGDHVAIDVGVYLSTESIIGDYVHIAPYVCVIGGANSKLIMGKFSGIAAGSKIICGSDDFTKGMMNPQIPLKYKETKFTTVTIEDFACVGVNCVIMPGVTLGEGSVIGAGSIVTKSTDPWTVYMGSPAKAVKKRKKDTIINNAKNLGYEF
jgi:dTDP-4-amino-4,6-dideoxy-D-glucose acyltransferase|tara:strand:+ start:2424 stop:2951 length:528 start_codon:yes stop_codon:yes gene_type:complete